MKLKWNQKIMLFLYMIENQKDMTTKTMRKFHMDNIRWENKEKMTFLVKRRTREEITLKKVQEKGTGQTILAKHKFYKIQATNSKKFLMKIEELSKIEQTH